MANGTGTWSQRWAAKENARRLNAHHQDLSRWNSDLELITWARKAATTASSRPSLHLPGLKLHRNEHVYWDSDGASMVEVPDTVQLFAPVLSVYSPTRRNAGYVNLAIAPNAYRDRGYVAITDQRIVFMGSRGNKEWAFGQLTGIAHGLSQPTSLFRVSSRQRLSGLVFEGSTAASFQLFTALCLALHRNEPQEFLAYLGQLEAAHLAQRPPAPPAATPADAPSLLMAGLRVWKRVYFGPSNASGARKVAPTLATAVALLCVCAALAAPPKGQQSPAALRVAPESPAVLLPSPSQAAPVVIELPPSSPPAPAPVVTTKAAPPPPAPTTPAAESTCGAPENPWGYDFCAGGSTISDPPSNFCSYFPCIDNFWNSTNGYVTECTDGMFSHSGGVSGSCSHHGGNGRKLTT